jgi:hypothetical protein
MRFNQTTPALKAFGNMLLAIAVAGTVVGLAGCGGAPKKANAMPQTSMQNYNQMMQKGRPAGSMPGMPGSPGAMPAGAPAGMPGGMPAGAPAGMPHR